MRPLTAAFVVLHGSRKLLQAANELPATSPAPQGSCQESSSLSTGLVVGYIVVCLVLVTLAGIMAGLTLGLLSIDKMDMEVIRRSGTEHEKWLVSKIEPVIAHPHYLLATLLLTNAVALEMLPIFLDRLLNPIAAILISVTAILLFGEIIPQAVCKRYRLEIGAYLAWFVRGLMFITGPITYPIALFLDWMLGEEPMFFRRHELKALVHMHGEPVGSEPGAEEGLTQDEVQVIMGALDMATKTAEAAMTPLNKVFMLSSDAVINDDLLKKVIDSGHSRVPVYEGSRENIIGLILVKELVLVDEDKGITIKELRLREIPFLRVDIPMYDVLRIFRSARKHMAVLTHVDRSLNAIEEAGDENEEKEGGGSDEGKEGGEAEAKGRGGSRKKKKEKGSGGAAAAAVVGNGDGEGKGAKEGGAEGEGAGPLHDSSSSTPQAAQHAGSGGGSGGGGGALDASASENASAAAAAAGADVDAASTQPAPSGASPTGISPRLSAASMQSLRSDEAVPVHAPQPVGIITIEDVLEELLQQEIVDETDRFVDNLQTKSARTLQQVPQELRHFLTRQYKDGPMRPSIEFQAMMAAAIDAAATARTMARSGSGQLRRPSSGATSGAAGAGGEGPGEGSQHSRGSRDFSIQGTSQHGARTALGVLQNSGDNGSQG